MVDIPCGVVGVAVQDLAVMEIQQEILSARTHHPQVLMRKIAQTWGQVIKQRAAT